MLPVDGRGVAWWQVTFHELYIVGLPDKDSIRNSDSILVGVVITGAHLCFCGRLWSYIGGQFVTSSRSYSRDGPWSLARIGLPYAQLLFCRVAGDIVQGKNANRHCVETVSMVLVQARAKESLPSRVQNIKHIHSCS